MTFCNNVALKSRCDRLSRVDPHGAWSNGASKHLLWSIYAVEMKVCAPLIRFGAERVKRDICDCDPCVESSLVRNESEQQPDPCIGDPGALNWSCAHGRIPLSSRF